MCINPNDFLGYKFISKNYVIFQLHLTFMFSRTVHLGCFQDLIKNVNWLILKLGQGMERNNHLVGSKKSYFLAAPTVSFCVVIWTKSIHYVHIFKMWSWAAQWTKIQKPNIQSVVPENYIVRTPQNSLFSKKKKKKKMNGKYCQI